VPSSYSGAFIVLNPNPITHIGDYTLCSFGAVKMRLEYTSGIYMYNEGAKYMLIEDLEGRGWGILQGDNFEPIKHLSELIPEESHLSGEHFEADYLDETDIVYDLSSLPKSAIDGPPKSATNGPYAAFVDGEYYEV